MDNAWLLDQFENGIRTITFNRPEARNAMTWEMRTALTEKLQEIDADPAVKALVLRGNGGSFIAGGDIKSFAETLQMSDEKRKSYFTTRINESTTFVMTLVNLTKPVIAVIEGDVAGAGISVALAADFTIVSKSSRFTFAHVQVGLALDVGLSYLLPRAIGIPQAKKLTMLGAKIGTDEASRLGMITHPVEDESVEEVLQKLLLKLTNLPAPALSAIKAELLASGTNELPAQLYLEAIKIGETAGTEEFKTRVNAFVRK